MIKNYENIAKQSEIKELLDFTFKSDQYYEENERVICKKIDINNNDWPKDIFYKVFNRLEFDHDIEKLFLWHHKNTNFGLHADCGEGDHKILGKNIMIPLSFDGNYDNATIIFKNKWFGSDVKFYNSDNTPFGDITSCTEYDPSKNINEKIYQKYLKHIDKKTLKGLEIEKIYKWNLGDVLTFDRQHIHCSGFSYAPRTAILVFTNKKEH